MKQPNTAIPLYRPGLVLVLCALALGLSAPAQAQSRLTQRQLRAYIPPDQLVSFLPSTPFNQFVEFVNPIFERVTGKRVIDPESNQAPIGITISGAHFLDALELVLEYNGLGYRETEEYFIIEPVAQAGAAPGGSSGGSSAPAGTPRAASELASLDTREIQINAVLFELNHSRARDQGVDWSVFFGEQQGGGGAAPPTSGEGNTTSRFFLKTGGLFRGAERFMLSPQYMDVGTLTNFFRYLEDEGVGETIASPSVTVQSGEEGNIQIGSDVPVQTRDFAGNTLTQFFKTGIIINVKPTLIRERVADTLGAPFLDFIHLDVQVEKSTSRPSGAGPVIDRNTAQTKVLLLDGEQTVIGGLYSNEETNSRRGIPILKDLPGWFFGLRYIFGTDQRTTAQKELLIVLQADVLEELRSRADRPFDEQLLNRARGRALENIRRVDEGLSRGVRMHEPPTRKKGQRRLEEERQMQEEGQ